MLFIVQLNNSFNFPPGWIKYIVTVIAFTYLLQSQQRQRTWTEEKRTLVQTDTTPRPTEDLNHSNKLDSHIKMHHVVFRSQQRGGQQHPEWVAVTDTSAPAWQYFWHLNEKQVVGCRTNWWFPEITGEDNLTVFSYSGRVKSPEWRRQLRRADLRTVLDLQAWTYYNLY